MRIVLLALFWVAAACQSGPALAAGASPLPAGVTARRSGAGLFFGDAARMTLYTYAQDARFGKSACNGDCARAWPPLIAAPGAQPVGDWSTSVRDDGTNQWAFRGKPLYTYAKDSYPGAALGDRVGNAWNVAFDPILLPPGTAIRSIFPGRVLTDTRGLTLYSRDDETPSAKQPARSACNGRCLDTWMPLAAPLLANRIGGWNPLPREDGTRQWAYQGHRLYLNVHDLKAGNTSGNGVDGRWHAAVLEPAPPLPAWVTVQRSDMGEIFADARGYTLYTFSGSLDKVRQTMCDDACLRKYWRSVPADAAARPSGEWTTIASAEDGGRRWAYKGNPLFTHTRDSAPGAIAGDKWAAGVGGGGGGWMPVLLRRDNEE